MTILITGGSGAIGTMVTRQLMEESSDSVALYDVMPSQDFSQDDSGRISFVQGDITDLSNLIRTVRKFNISEIIHLAGYLLETNPYTSLNINSLGTYNLLETARLSNVKTVVCASTSGVLGPASARQTAPTYDPIDEDVPARPNSFYGISKQLGELYGVHYASTFGLDYRGLRFSRIYGPGRLSGRNPYAVIDRVVLDAVRGKPVSYNGKGDVKYDWVYIKDVARGVILALRAKNVEHRVFHIAAGEGWTMGDVRNIIQTILPNSKFEIETGRGNPDYDVGQGSIMSIARAKKELGYSPKYNLKSGLEDYIRILRSSPSK